MKYQRVLAAERKLPVAAVVPEDTDIKYESLVVICRSKIKQFHVHVSLCTLFTNLFNKGNCRQLFLLHEGDHKVRSLQSGLISVDLPFKVVSSGNTGPLLTQL